MCLQYAIGLMQQSGTKDLQVQQRHHCFVALPPNARRLYLGMKFGGFFQWVILKMN
jgi:hypothetical protein